MKTILPMVMTALVAAATAAEVPPAVEPAVIPAYKLLRPGLAVAGQPSPDALARLGQMGFRTVVNLRSAAEGPADEKGVVEAQGLGYVSIPILADTFSLADVLAVEKILDDPKAAPVLLHCASSNRVGATWAVIQARKGKSLAEAEEAGRAAGMHSPQMEAAVRRVLGATDAALPAAPAKP
jgi:uncharacterized protein (TIGR01244 family)